MTFIMTIRRRALKEEINAHCTIGSNSSSSKGDNDTGNWCDRMQTSSPGTTNWPRGQMCNIWSEKTRGWRAQVCC